MNLQTNSLQLELGPKSYVRIRDLTIKAGEKVLIEGPSGCGKTSLLHVLGLLKPAMQGTIHYNDQIASEPIDQFRRQHFGFIFQRLSLIEHLTVEENILLDEVDRIHPEILEKLELSNRARDQVAPLSLGEQQRVAIARALHKHPQILFADEPTSSLDRPFAETIGKAISELKNSTVLAVSHDERILKYFDRVLTWKELLA